MPVSATDNMELPLGSPQLEVRAVRLHGKGLVLVTCPLHIFSVNWSAVCGDMSLK